MKEMCNKNGEGTFVEKNLMIEQKSPEELEEARERRRRKKKWQAVFRVFDRIFGFLMATVFMVGIFAFGVGYILTSKDYPSLRESFVATMDETRRFTFVPRIYLTAEESAEILERRHAVLDEKMDPSMIHVAARDPEQTTADPNTQPEQQPDPYGYVDEDGDGYILVPVSGRGYNGYMLIVLDPTRCFVARGGEGQTINLIAQRNGAIGGINGGAFVDDGGTGTGKDPEGLTIIDGRLIESARYARESFVGFDENGILHVGYYNYSDCLDLGIVGGVTFEPPLIINGVPQDTSYIVSGVNPRTAIGQRADGAILMLVIDGRQLSSAGATYADLIDIMLQFGAVNAINLDGGSSTVMYLNGELVNSPSSSSGYSRGLPNAFLFR